MFLINMKKEKIAQSWKIIVYLYSWFSVGVYVADVCTDILTGYRLLRGACPPQACAMINITKLPIDFEPLDYKGMIISWYF